jgi:hypothetical protein
MRDPEDLLAPLLPDDGQIFWAEKFVARTAAFAVHVFSVREESVGKRRDADCKGGGPRYGLLFHFALNFGIGKVHGR